MFNARALLWATVGGTVLQVAMVLWGHTNPSVARLFPVGGMTISLLAGGAYALMAPGGSAGSRALGGLIAGGASALLGILVSYSLGDVPAPVLAFGTLSSAVTGALGGWLGKFAARGPGAVAGCVVLNCLLGPMLHAQGTAAAPTPAAVATTRDFGWLAGRWQGRMKEGSGVAEVVFGPPAAGVIVGVMRLVDRDTVQVVELISLADTPNGVEMRFRHFSTALMAYEPTFKQAMRLTTHAAEEDVFENQEPYDRTLLSTQPRVTVFRRVDPGTFVGTSNIIGGNGKPAVIEVTYRRVP